MTPVQKARSVFENPEDNPFPAGISYIEQNRLSRWQLKNFGSATTEQLALGVCEEVGELAFAVLKHSQAIRGMDDEEAFLEAAGDAVADIIIFAIQMATKLRLDIGTLVVDTIEEVTKRDWSRKGPQPEIHE